MKKLEKKFLIGTAFATSVVTMAGCAPEANLIEPGTLNNGINMPTELNGCVYGPPEDFALVSPENIEPEIDVTNEINGDVYGTPVEDLD